MRGTNGELPGVLASEQRARACVIEFALSAAELFASAGNATVGVLDVLAGRLTLVGIGVEVIAAPVTKADKGRTTLTSGGKSAVLAPVHEGLLTVFSLTGGCREVESLRWFATEVGQKACACSEVVAVAEVDDCLRT